jgi:hypothetical protein
MHINNSLGRGLIVARVQTTSTKQKSSLYTTDCIICGEQNVTYYQHYYHIEKFHCVSAISISIYN